MVNTDSTIRTNYTCANGPNGVGCPCITPTAHSALVNHGQTLLQPTISKNNIFTIAPLLDTNPNNRQIFTDTRCINDYDITRPSYDINKVEANGPRSDN